MKTAISRTLTAATLLGITSLSANCGLVPLDILDALPSDNVITLRVPGAKVPTSPGSTSLLPLLGGTSEYHAQSTQISTAVNTNVLDLVRRIRTIVGYPPSKQSGNVSTWGPYSPGGLDALNYRFTATRSGEAHYLVTLEARPQVDQTEAGFKTLLDGDLEGVIGGGGGNGKGTFTVYLDNRAAVDSNWLVRGSLRIAYDASADPRTINVDLDGFDPAAASTGSGGLWDDVAPAPAAATYRYAEASDHSGTFLFTFHLNVQDASLPGAETLTLRTRWNADGLGRGDSTISGEDVATQLQGLGLQGDTIHASECWDADFNVTFQDSDPAELRTTVRDLQGDPAACVFTQADYPETASNGL
jgi:hypothetical protein